MLLLLRSVYPFLLLTMCQFIESNSYRIGRHKEEKKLRSGRASWKLRGGGSRKNQKIPMQWLAGIPLASSLKDASATKEKRFMARKRKKEKGEEKRNSSKEKKVKEAALK